MSMTRQVRLGGKYRQVVSIMSSGLGTQYSVMMDNNQVLCLSDETVKANPEHAEWLEICRDAFDDSTTFGKPIGENLSGKL